MQGSLLLTGGTGFFGRALLRNYLSNRKGFPFKIVVLSRNPERFQASYPEFSECPWLSYRKGDIQNRESLPWGESFTYVLHAATDSTIGPSLAPLRRFQQIVDGTTNILDVAVATGALRFLLTSSGGIYGPQPSELAAIPEDWLGSPSMNDPGTAYSQAKRAAEHLCALYREAYGLETVIARCFAFVGPDLPLNVHFAVGNFVRDALFSAEINVKGDGSPLRSYLDQRDLSRWLWFLLFNGKDGEVFNVGSDSVVSIQDLANTVKRILAPHKCVRIVKSRDPKILSSRSRYIPDISKIASLHGLTPTFSLEESIRFMAKSHVV